MLRDLDTVVNVVSTEQLHNPMLRRTLKADTIDRGRGIGRRKGVPNQIPQNRAREVVRKRILSAATAEDTSKSDVLVVYRWLVAQALVTVLTQHIAT